MPGQAIDYAVAGSSPTLAASKLRTGAFDRKKHKIDYVTDWSLAPQSSGLLQAQQFGQQMGGKGGAMGPGAGMGTMSLPDFSSVNGGQDAQMDPLQSSIARRRARLADMKMGDPNQKMKGF